MKTKFKQALMIVAVIFWGTSCGDDAEDKPESRIATDVTSLTFEHGGGSLQLAVQSNTDWTIDKSGCAWVTVNTLAGSGDQTITVTAPKNTGTHRTGKIILRADDKSKEVDITQYSAVLSFGVPSVSAVLKSNLPITDETHLVIPYSGGIGNESFTVSVTTTATGINAVNNFAITLSAPAGEILVPLSGTPVTAGEATFNITVSYTHPTTGEPVAISPLTVTVEAGATLVVGTLSLSENNLVYTKSVGDNLRLLLPYSDALGIEVFTLSIAVSGEAAPGVVTENVFDVTITQPGNGTIEIPVTGTPYKAGTVNFAVTGDEDSRTFTLDAAEINQSMNATVTDNGKRYYNGAFVISGVMSDPRGSDAPAAGDGATFNNPHMEGEKKHSGGYEYMQFLALEEINFAQTPYSVIVTNTPNNTAGPAGWMEGGARTYKFNLTEGTVSKGEFFYVGGTAKALGGYRNDAVDNVTNWPNVPVGITSMANSKWIRTIAFNGNDGDDGIGSSINGIFLNYHATQNRFNSIAVFKGTAVENNSIP
ncbi:MAG: BACON domain-containing protein, partial [Bacteroidales bacterium]|nr:BACON domain-containing protein [Bacteroidales bacterium]